MSKKIDIEETIIKIVEDYKELNDRVRAIDQDCADQYQIDRLERKLYALQFVVYAIPVFLWFGLVVWFITKIGV